MKKIMFFAILIAASLVPTITNSNQGQVNQTRENVEGIGPLRENVEGIGVLTLEN